MNILQIGCVAGLLLLEDVEINLKKIVERGDGGLILHYQIVSR
jgi:hypothetical protein